MAAADLSALTPLLTALGRGDEALVTALRLLEPPELNRLGLLADVVLAERGTGREQARFLLDCVTWCRSNAPWNPAREEMAQQAIAAFTPLAGG